MLSRQPISYGGYRTFDDDDSMEEQEGFRSAPSSSYGPPATSHTYQSPAPTVPCSSNLMFSCAPQVSPVPCQAASYAPPAPTYSAPAPKPAPSYAPSYSAPAPSYGSAPSHAPSSAGYQRHFDHDSMEENNSEEKKMDW